MNPTKQELLQAIDLIIAEYTWDHASRFIANHFEDETTHTEGAIFTSMDINDTAWIVFRATDSVKNIVIDFLFPQLVIPYGNYDSKIMVHGGFLLSYIGYARGYIQSWLKDHGNIKRVVLIGHSLGAALATLCAVDIQYNFPGMNIQCITFGSPRVGNKSFADSYNKRVPHTFRYVYKNDFIIHMPPKCIGFEHIGYMTQLGKPGCLSFKDHDIMRYREAINTEVIE
jgi:triacylglycerol lipase